MHISRGSANVAATFFATPLRSQGQFPELSAELAEADKLKVRLLRSSRDAAPNGWVVYRHRLDEKIGFQCIYI